MKKCLSISFINKSLYRKNQQKLQLSIYTHNLPTKKRPKTIPFGPCSSHERMADKSPTAASPSGPS